MWAILKLLFAVINYDKTGTYISIHNNYNMSQQVYSFRYCAENPCGELDPSNSLTFDIISALVEELTQIFPDNFFHFGADEGLFYFFS